MELNKEYTRIYVKENSDNYDVLKGKVIDKISLAEDRRSYDMNELIITFTDKTYIAFEIEYVSEDHESERSPVISNSWVMDSECFNSGNFHCHISVRDGELRFDQMIENRIKLGLWKLTMEEAQQRIKDDAHKQDEWDYKAYLRLKKKFTGREEEFKYLEDE